MPSSPHAPFSSRRPLASHLPPQALRHTLRRPARGLVTVLVMVLLVGAVLGGLTMLLNVQTAQHAEMPRHGESDRALFVAESGLDAAQARLSTLLGDGYTQASCTGLGTHFGTTNVGDGSFTITGVSTPATCNNASITPCQQCAITASAQVGAARRGLSSGVVYVSAPGATCNGAGGQSCTNASAPPPTWKLHLSNPSTDAAIGVFHLAAKRTGSNVGTQCTNAACRLEWVVNSRNGGRSLDGISNAVPIAAGGTALIYNQLTTGDHDLAAVGALFPALTAGTPPTLTGRPVAGGAAYWQEPNGGGAGGTVGRSSDTTGVTNNGVLTDPATNTCTTAPVTGSVQACTNWCYGGNTLVFGFASGAASTSEALASVSFDTEVISGVAGQAVPLLPVAKFPTATTAGAPSTVYSELWYAQNPEYLSPANSANSGTTFTAYAGVHFTAGLSNNSNQMVVTAIQGGSLAVGNVVRCVVGTCPAILNSGTVTISAQLSGAAGGNGTYRLSANCNNPGCSAGRSAGVTSTRLTVTAIAGGGTLSVGNVISSTGTPLPNITAGTTLTAVPGGGTAPGNYTISSAQLVSSRTMTAASTTNIVTVTGGTTVPLPNTLLAVRSGAGVLPPGTRVLATPAPTATSFAISNPPTTALSGATLCGGTCAFFRHGVATTQFTITKPLVPAVTNASDWGAGFMCLKNAGTPSVVNSLSTSGRRWTEVVVN